MKPPGNGPFVPPRTRAELSSPAPPGGRHGQMLKLVLPLLGAGLSGEAVFVQLRSMYDGSVSDREIRNLIELGEREESAAVWLETRRRGREEFPPCADSFGASDSGASNRQRQRVAGRFPL